MPISHPHSEPIRKPRIWVGLVLVLLAGVPWYLPAGTIHPIILGMPLWTLIAMLSSVALCAHLTWILTRHWKLVEDEEEGNGRKHSGRATTERE